MSELHDLANALEVAVHDLLVLGRGRSVPIAVEDVFDDWMDRDGDALAGLALVEAEALDSIQ